MTSHPDRNGTELIDEDADVFDPVDNAWLWIHGLFLAVLFGGLVYCALYALARWAWGSL